MSGMPASPIENIAIFFGTYCPPGFYLQGGTSVHTAHTFTVRDGTDPLEIVVRRAAESCQGAYRDLGLVSAIDMEPVEGGWRVTFHLSMYCAEQRADEIYDEVSLLVPWCAADMA